MIDTYRGVQMRHQMLTLLTLLGVPSALIAQSPQPTCTTSVHHAFDFWIGEWEVTDTAGVVQATSSITSMAGGCAIMEHWQPKQGARGVSINWLEPTDGKWHQQWVGGDGWIAGFVGGYRDGVMTLLATVPRKTPQGEVQDKMTYQLLPDGRVRQKVLNSRDGGKTWTVGFLGDYRKK
jgi:hypothetical protein